MKIREANPREAACRQEGKPEAKTNEPAVPARRPAPRMLRYLCVSFDPLRTGIHWDDRLESLTERHRLTLALPEWNEATEVMPRVETGETAGLILVLDRGWLGRGMMRICKQVLASGRRVYLYWPSEQAFECLDQERLGSYWRHWLVLQSYRRLRRLKEKGRWVLRKVKGLLRLLRRPAPVVPNPVVESLPQPTPSCYQPLMVQLDRQIHSAQPIEFSWLQELPTNDRPIPGTGVYLRTDFWAPIISGGSYGHSCYVAKSLAKVTENLVCLMPHHYRMLDEFPQPIRQIVMDVPSTTCNEKDIVRASRHYYRSLKTLVEYLRPAYIYERLCLGNTTAARLSQKLGIPYIVEYNGSEIAMKRSFDGRGYDLEELYLKAEMAAFQQAILISVVSEPIKEELISRGVSPDKILVNPNAADPDDYCPPSAEEKARLRAELGWGDEHRVVGFTGTFGGWHGIDVLAQVLPLICKAAPQVRFLLIGDGNFKSLVDEAIQVHKLQDRVYCTGRVEQAEGRRLLGACDIFVSPHNRHMVGSRFFGSPTKIFEYMAMGTGIVSSDLEQIGEVLSPGLRVNDIRAGRFSVTDQRSILCKPGDVEELAQGVLALVKDPALCAALGRNARQALLDHYCWDQHIEKLWRFKLGLAAESPRPAPEERSAFTDEGGMSRLPTGDGYKDEVQNQWDANPCGSHYVKNAPQHTLDWYLEAEAYRYGNYAPWMAETMEFANFAGKEVLEVGGGMGTDLAQFAKHGACVTDVDLSAGHLVLAQENFRLRGLTGRFVHRDAETLPFPDASFDLVYSNGVIHHTPNTEQVVKEMHRVLRPGGRAIVMVYAENSLHYWRNLVRDIGLYASELEYSSMGDVMSRHVEITENGAKPLVKVYTPQRLRKLFRDFKDLRILQRQITAPELMGILSWIPLRLAGRLMGWNLIIKAVK